jgi:transcription antitermination protein NusB
MQALYAYYKHDGESSLKKSEQELAFSIQKAYDLYHYLLILIVDVADYANSRMELALLKKIPTPEDLHPNTKFINNTIIRQIRINKHLLQYLQTKKLSWVNYPELIKGIYNLILASDDYQNYMNTTESSYKDDKNLVSNIYKNCIAVYDPLYQNLEEQSIYWNDEPEFIIGIILKTLKKFKEEDAENAELSPLFTNAEDEEFSKKLLRKVILNYNEYIPIIEKFSKNWEVDRIAFIDTLLMQMAIAEVIEFPSIPVKVTLNEYLEIAKYYSTSKSNIFLNGILDKAFTYLKENNLIKKEGRGLIGDV